MRGLLRDLPNGSGTLSNKESVSLCATDWDAISRLVQDWYQDRHSSVVQKIIGDRKNKADAKQALRIIRAITKQRNQKYL